MKKLVSLLSACAVAAFTAAVQTPALAAASGQGPAAAAELSGAAAYTAYRERQPAYPDAAQEITVAGADFAQQSGDAAILAEYEGQRRVLQWETAGSTVSYTVDVPQDAVYVVKLTYRQAAGGDDPIRLGLAVDGSVLFSGLEELELPRLWTNDGGVRIDLWGNEFTAEQKEYLAFSTFALCDSDGIVTAPYELSLAAGRHTFTFTLKKEALLLASLVLAPPERAQPYLAAAQTYTGLAPYTGSIIALQGEDAAVKTSRSLTAKADTQSAGLTPSSPTKTVLNYIGSSNWSSPGQSLSWTFTAPASGLYKLGFKFKQSELLNGVSYRHLKIDGVTPFAEAGQIPFAYGPHWQFYEYVDKNEEPYLLYLEEGEHVLSLSVTLAETAAFYQRLEQVIQILGDLYVKIYVITGETPDANRDYDLFRQIPQFEDTLQESIDRLSGIADDIMQQTGQRSDSLVAAINNMVRVLTNMRDNVYTAQLYLTDYYSAYTSLGVWLYDMKSMPLSIDEILLAAPEAPFGRQTATLLESAGFGITRFFHSFFKDYASVPAAGEKGHLTIWVNWGRDQTQILSALIQQEFTAGTGIGVNLKTVDAGIVKGILSGNPPDLSLHMARTEPVNLAMRGALYDLEQFADFEQVMQRFMPTAATPYRYRGGCYALPDTQAFYILYYRKDILSQLGVKVPDTWDAFLDAATVLQRNSMNVWIPYTKITSTATVNTGVGGLSLFPTLMLQNGLSLYTDGLDGAALDTVPAYRVFRGWTDLYTRYKLPREASFYNRFRVGTMPLGIEVYTLYQTLMDAAPEIQDMWGVAPLPGTVRETGEIDRSAAGSGTGAGIIAGTGNEEAAWEFIKWWTQADTQADYSRDVESILGVVGRTPSANVEAVTRMSWNGDDLENILEQWRQVSEIPEVPGSYYLSRALDQAFWAVTNRTSEVKDALISWNQIADNEIKRKIREYAS